MKRVLIWVVQVFFFVGIGLLVANAWVPFPRAVTGAVGGVVAVLCLGRLVAGGFRWMASDDFEGEVWEREHALRSGRRP